MPELLRDRRRRATRSCPSPTALTTYAPAPSTANEPERTSSPRLRDAGVGLAGQDRLVEREPVAALERPVGDDLVALLDQDEVALDDLVDVDVPRRAVAHDRGVRRDERREPVERPLRAHLLRDADAGVGDEDREEERVLRLAERERQHAEDEQDQVEDREDVGDDDALVGAARLLRLGRPGGEPALRLLLRQALERNESWPRPQSRTGSSGDSGRMRCEAVRPVLLTREYPPEVYGGAGIHVEYLARELGRIAARRGALLRGGARAGRRPAGARLRAVGRARRRPGLRLGAPGALGRPGDDRGARSRRRSCTATRGTRTSRAIWRR